MLNSRKKGSSIFGMSKGHGMIFLCGLMRLLNWKSIASIFSLMV